MRMHAPCGGPFLSKERNHDSASEVSTQLQYILQRVISRHCRCEFWGGHIARLFLNDINGGMCNDGTGSWLAQDTLLESFMTPLVR